MKTQEIHQYGTRAYDSLDQKKFRDAFEALSPVLSELQNWQLNEKKNELETTYKFMLRYLTEGVKDPEQRHIYEDLLKSGYELADDTLCLINTKYSPEVYFEKRRASDHLPEKQNLALLTDKMEEISEKIALTRLLEENDPEKSPRIILLEKQKEQLSGSIFQAIWLSDRLLVEDYQIISGLISNRTCSYIIKSLIISAITMGLQFRFDGSKALLLLQAAENEEAEVSLRAMTGILIFLRQYDSRLWLYPEIGNRLSILSENTDFRNNIRKIILQFILSKETEKISRKMQEEIIPEMMKISPELRNKVKLDDLMGEAGMDDKNPEWMEMIEKSGLGEKLKEFSELQMEGADIMHSSFTHLKGYAFFNEISNWFVPFYENPAVIPANCDDGNQKMLKTLEESSMLCNSDKYSFFLSISQIPETYRNMMAGQFTMESDAFKEMQKESLPGNFNKSTVIIKQYIQDLYRFYKIHPKKSSFTDIFDGPPEYPQIGSIGQIISDQDSRMIIGEYYFNRNYYTEAVFIFEKLIEEGVSSDVLYQKLGFCHQMTGDLENALQCYLKAELLNSHSAWTIKKIAHCYRMLKKPEDALEYYRKAELLNPDNLSVQLSIGHCHLELKNYPEALKCYFKVEYLDKKGERAWRPIAWCSFLTGKYGQASDYFEKIIELKPGASDFLNYGHTELAGGNIQKALELYKSSIHYPGNSIEKFNEDLKNDLPELLRAGIKEDDIPLLLDRLMYDLS